MIEMITNLEITISGLYQISNLENGESVAYTTFISNVELFWNFFLIKTVNEKLGKSRWKERRKSVYKEKL